MSATLLHAKHVPADNQTVVFRNSSYRGLLFAGMLFALIALYAGLPGDRGVNWAASLIPAGLALLLLTLGIWNGFSTGRNQWIMAAAPDGLYINLGGTEGYSQQTDDVPILFLPPQEIMSICCTHESIRLPHRFGLTHHHHGFMDVALVSPAPDEALDAAGNANETHANAGKAGPFPIRFVSPRLVRVCSNAMNPSEQKAIDCLAAFSAVAPRRKVRFPDWDALNDLQRDIFLQELWLMGMRDESLFLARVYWRVSSKEALETLRKRYGAPGRIAH